MELQKVLTLLHMYISNCVECDLTSMSFLGIWFEVTPHEAGFTELGVFVETSLLGSKFQSGEVKEKRPEMDMVKLQGKLSHLHLNIRLLRQLLPIIGFLAYFTKSPDKDLNDFLQRSPSFSKAR